MKGKRFLLKPKPPKKPLGRRTGLGRLGPPGPKKPGGGRRRGSWRGGGVGRFGLGGSTSLANTASISIWRSFSASLTVSFTSSFSWLLTNCKSWSESSQTMTARVWHATSCQDTPSLYLLFCTFRQASSWYSCHPSMVMPTSNSVSIFPLVIPSQLSGCFSPVLRVLKRV